MAIDRAQLLALWKLDELPACVEGMELAARFLERAGDAVDRLDDPTQIIAVKNALIRAHKDLIDHRATCPNCNEV
ncbi:MAG TPA: hypothetical protein VK578_18935 [Edaphobacter sp.]|nr:hypothetical protein [Edaphobacter sp.]